MGLIKTLAHCPKSLQNMSAAFNPAEPFLLVTLHPNFIHKLL